jgi:hypothetical protein
MHRARLNCQGQFGPLPPGSTNWARPTWVKDHDGCPRPWIGYTFDPASPSADKVKVLTDFEGC